MGFVIPHTHIPAVKNKSAVINTFFIFAFCLLLDDLEDVINLDLDNETDEETEDEETLATVQSEITEEENTKDINDPQGPEAKVL